MRSAVWLSTLALFAAIPANAGELRATIHNVKPNQGKVMVAVYDTADAYAAGRRAAAVALEPTGEPVLAVFPDLPAGRYAVAVFQDLDGDGRLGKSALGMPLEPYGFSRNAAGVAGPPGFDAIAVSVAEGAAETRIDLTP